MSTSGKTRTTKSTVETVPCIISSSSSSSSFVPSFVFRLATAVMTTWEGRAAQGTRQSEWKNNLEARERDYTTYASSSSCRRRR